jgi:phospholipid/cholesterol/gamma-HCH transport system permease protein
MSRVSDLAGRPVEALDSLGEQMRFYVRSLAWSPRTLRRYRRR